MAKDFVFTYEGVDYWVDDLTLAEAMEVEAKCGDWPEWQPIRNLRLAFTIMTVFLRRTMSEDDVATIIGGLSKRACRAMWDFREEEMPAAFENGVPVPKAVGEPSTPTS